MRGQNYCFCFVIIHFKLDIHTVTSWMHSCINCKVQLNYVMGQIFLTACHRQMSGDESSDVQLHQRGVWHRGQTEQAPGQSPEARHMEREQDETLSC